MDIAKAYPDPVNVDGLMEIVRAVYPFVSAGGNGFRVHQIAPENAAAVSSNLDAIIAAHDHTALTLDQQNKIEDNANLSDLLSLYNAGLTQIANDQDDISTGKTALANATTLVQVKPIVDGMLDLMQRQLNREERTLKALRAVVRTQI